MVWIKHPTWADWREYHSRNYDKVPSDKYEWQVIGDLFDFAWEQMGLSMNDFPSDRSWQAPEEDEDGFERDPEYTTGWSS